MENFIHWLFSSFYDFIFTLTNQTVVTINDLFGDSASSGDYLHFYEVNLTLFSETPILTINLQDLLVLFFSVFYTVIFIVISWKIIKKVFVKITGWRKW